MALESIRLIIQKWFISSTLNRGIQEEAENKEEIKESMGHVSQ